MHPIKAALVTYGFTILFALLIALIIQLMGFILRRASRTTLGSSPTAPAVTPNRPDDAIVAVAVAAAKSKTA